MKLILVLAVLFGGLMERHFVYEDKTTAYQSICDGHGEIKKAWEIDITTMSLKEITMKRCADFFEEAP